MVNYNVSLNGPIQKIIKDRTGLDSKEFSNRKSALNFGAKHLKQIGDKIIIEVIE